MVHGDSQLVIKFLNRLNVPKKPVFVTLVAEIRALLATLPVSVKFVHMARAKTSWQIIWDVWCSSEDMM